MHQSKMDKKEEDYRVMIYLYIYLYTHFFHSSYCVETIYERMKRKKHKLQQLNIFFSINNDNNKKKRLQLKKIIRKELSI